MRKSAICAIKETSAICNSVSVNTSRSLPPRLRNRLHPSLSRLRRGLLLARGGEQPTRESRFALFFGAPYPAELKLRSRRGHVCGSANGTDGSELSRRGRPPAGARLAIRFCD